MNFLKFSKFLQKFAVFFLLTGGVYALPMMEGQTQAQPAEPSAPPALPLTPNPRSSARSVPPLVDPNAPVVYSRTVKAQTGQQVEIPFGGNGWVFLGEEKGQKGVSYLSHRFDSEGQSFLFEAEKAGVYGLSFYKQDFVRDFLMNDHVKVIVEEADKTSSDSFSKISRSPVTALPRWPTAEQESAWASGDIAGAMPPAAAPPKIADIPQAAPGTPPAAEQAAAPPQAAPQPPENASPGQYLDAAQKAFDAKDAAGALALLDQFREKFPDGTDEAWWLYAQAFEANGPAKDVKSARYNYQRLVNEFPLSSHWTDAQNRIKYLDRYYFNIQ